MTNEEFPITVSEKTGIDINIVSDLFDKYQEDTHKVAQILIEKHGADKNVLGKLWGSQIGFAYVDPNSSIVNHKFIDKIGIKFILEHKAIPLYKFGKAVTVSTSNPKNPYIQDRMEKAFDEIVSLVFCFSFDIEKFLQVKA